MPPLHLPVRSGSVTHDATTLLPGWSGRETHNASTPPASQIWQRNTRCHHSAAALVWQRNTPCLPFTCQSGLAENHNASTPPPNLAWQRNTPCLHVPGGRSTSTAALLQSATATGHSSGRQEVGGRVASSTHNASTPPASVVWQRNTQCLHSTCQCGLAEKHTMPPLHLPVWFGRETNNASTPPASLIWHWQRNTQSLHDTCQSISSSSSRMRVINHNWSATKQRPHPQSVA